jgi:hypothetical protein
VWFLTRVHVFSCCVFWTLYSKNGHRFGSVHTNQNVLCVMRVPAVLPGSECWARAERQKGRLKGAEQRSLRAPSGCGLADHGHNEDKMEDLQIADTNSRNRVSNKVATAG